MESRGDDQKKQQRKADEREIPTGGNSFTRFFRGLESFLDTVARLEANQQERTYEGETADPSGRLKAAFNFSIKSNLLDNLPTQSTEMASVPAREHTRRDRTETKIGPFIDVFDERDHVLINIEFPGVEEEMIHTEVHGDIFIVSTESPNAATSKEVILPAHTDASTVTRKYTNGILEIRMSKVEDGRGDDSTQGG